jgi:CHASE2 domain-containing sensor protein
MDLRGPKIEGYGHAQLVDSDWCAVCDPERTSSMLVFLQIGALGYLVGVLKWLTRRPDLMRGYGILCGTFAVGLVLILWGLWAAYRAVMRASRRL